MENPTGSLHGPESKDGTSFVVIDELKEFGHCLGSLQSLAASKGCTVVLGALDQKGMEAVLVTIEAESWNRVRF
jgi:hypothetical protein